MNDFYTDPQIHTKSGKGFGEGNLGKDGIYQFVKSHQCNPLCTYLKLEPLNSSRRMLLRGTLPVVQLEFDKNTQSAVIKDDGSGSAGDEDDDDEKKRGPVQHPLQPTATPTSPARRENSWLAAQPPPNSALDAHNSQEPAGQAQNPLQPKTAGSAPAAVPATNGAASSAPPAAAPVASSAAAAPAAASAPAAAAAAPAASAPAAAQPAAVSAPAQDSAPEPAWDLKAFKLMETVRGSQAECIVSDDKLLYSGSSDGSLGIWDPVALKHVGNFKAGHTKAVKSLVLHKGVLYSAGSDAAIKEWDIENQKVVNEVKDKGEINSICLQDNLIFSGSNDKTVKVCHPSPHPSFESLFIQM